MIPGCLPDFRSKEGISAAWLWERRTGWGQSGLWGAGHLWMALLRSWGLGRSDGGVTEKDSGGWRRGSVSP